jgi:hypothetical protein
MREEHRLRVFENRVLRRIFGSKRDEVTGVWRKLLGILYCLSAGKTKVGRINARVMCGRVVMV